MKKRGLYIVLGCLFLLVAVFCAFQVLKRTYTSEPVMSEEYAPASATAAPSETEQETSTEETTEETTEDAAASDTAQVDFDALQSVNSDIYAWLEIDNTNISYPVVQSADDDTFYLDHNTDGEYSAAGSIFSEAAYNSKDMSDPVVILYGHHMASGAMFGDLQQYYTDSEFFEENNTIRVYTPDETLEYGVFAAVPYSSEHILYTYDFTDDAVFESFFEGILNIRDLEAQFCEDYAPEAGDRVLILSTCLAGDQDNRFLVMATLLD